MAQLLKECRHPACVVGKVMGSSPVLTFTFYFVLNEFAPLFSRLVLHIGLNGDLEKKAKAYGEKD